MDAYTFMRVDCGKVDSVLETLVRSKRVPRAVALTGRYDVVARLEDVSWDDLADFGINELGAIEGVKETTTAVAVDPRALDIVVPPLPMPIRKLEIRGGALVRARIAAGAGAELLVRLYSAEGIEAVALLTGEDDLLIQLGGETVEEVARTVVTQIHPLRGIERTATSLILKANPVRLRGGFKTPRRKPARGASRGSGRR